MCILGCGYFNLLETKCSNVINQMKQHSDSSCLQNITIGKFCFKSLDGIFMLYTFSSFRSNPSSKKGLDERKLLTMYEDH